MGHEHHHDHDHEDHGHVHHDHGHHHHGPGGHHHDVSEVSDGRLLISIALNLLLTFVEVGVGLVSGSLALLADAAHNFNDCVALMVAYGARRIARRGPDAAFTFGYRRAELVGALINLTALMVVGAFLLGEAVHHLFVPKPVLGLWVMVASAVALVVDLATAGLLWSMSHGNMNVRAAFLHNLSDAASSFAVLLGGLAIYLGGPSWIDPALTLVLAAYIMHMAWGMLKATAAILMEGTPHGVQPGALREAMIAREVHLHDVRHLHVWALDESTRALEACLVVHDACDLDAIRALLHDTRTWLHEHHDITHATLEVALESWPRDARPGCWDPDTSDPLEPT